METYQKNGETKTKVKRIGMGPVQRDDVEYDFTTLINLDIDGNTGTVGKDRTGVFGEPNTVIGRLTEIHGRALAKWLYTGAATEGEKIIATVADKRREVIFNIVPLNRPHADAFNLGLGFPVFLIRLHHMLLLRAHGHDQVNRPAPAGIQ